MTAQLSREDFANMIIDGLALKSKPESNRWREILTSDLEDEALMRELNEINEQPAFYHPFKVEILLNDASTLISLCLQRRTELKNMESILLTDSVNKLNVFLKRQYEDEIRSAEKVFTSSHEILGKQTRLELEEKYVMAGGESSKEVKIFDDKTKEAKDKFVSQSRVYEDFLINYSNKEGSGVNYLQRYMLIRNLYQEDLKEAFRKLVSIKAGLKIVYQKEYNPFPKVEQELVNTMYTWSKMALRGLTKFLEQEQEYTIPLSLSYGYSLPYPHSVPDPTQPPDLIKIFSGDFSASRDSGVFKFKIPKEVFPGRKNIRLRSIGAGFLRPKAAEGQAIPDNWNIRLVIPPQLDADGEKTIFVPPITIALSHLAVDRFQDDMVKCLSLFNLNPVSEDDWEIQLSAQSTHSYPRNRIDDIVLFLGIASIPE